jgi:hypothetical protein
MVIGAAQMVAAAEVIPSVVMPAPEELNEKEASPEDQGERVQEPHGGGPRVYTRPRARGRNALFRRQAVARRGRPS